MKKEVPVSEGLRQLPIRPVYLVSMKHERKENIITVGMFAFYSSKPSLVGIGIAPSRYSHELIHKSQEYAVNVVDENLIEATRICGEKSGIDTDKFELAKLTPQKGAKINAPTIKESPVSIECKVVQEIETGDHTLFIGEVLATHVREGYNWNEGLLLKWVGEDGYFFRAGERIARY